MRITFLTTLKAYWGGCEELWVNTATLAISGGHHVQVVVYKQKIGLHPSLQKLQQKALSFVQLENDIMPKSFVEKGLRALKHKISISEYKPIEQFSPDCVVISQAYNYDAAFFVTLSSLLLKLHTPFYLISQFNFEHKSLSFSEIQKARAIFKKAALVFFVSLRNKQVTERQIAQQIKQAHVIDNPVNLIEKNHLPYPSLIDNVFFASVARLEIDFKGQDILLQVLSGKTWAERKWLLNIYGTGPDEEYLKELAGFYAISDKVIFHGHVHDIKTVWLNNHLLLMPSTAEGKPLAIEEAMLCGRVVVASDVAGNAELIDDNINGYIASSFYPKPFEEAMERAWKQQDQWESIGLKAHQKMMSALDPRPHETMFSAIQIDAKTKIQLS